MKKSLLLILLSIYSFTTIHAEITWTLSDDGTLTISGTDMPDYDYGIWDINGVIEERSSCPWFSQREKIKKVVIESGVTNIGENAFCRFSNLTSVTIPNSVTSIAKNAFHFSSSPTSVTIGSLVEFVELRAYFSNTTSVTILDGVESIGNSAFSGCSGLTSVTIPNSVTSIEYSAFSFCI